MITHRCISNIFAASQRGHRPAALHRQNTPSTRRSGEKTEGAKADALDAEEQLEKARKAAVSWDKNPQFGCPAGTTGSLGELQPL